MSAPDQPAGENQGTWLEGRDILPANLPACRPPAAAAPSRPDAEPRRRRPRPWSLLVGLPLVALLFFGLGTLVGTRVLVAGGSNSSSGGVAIHTAANVGGDQLLSEQIETTPKLPLAPPRFLEAMFKGNGQAMWQELSAAYQQQITQQGGSPQALAQAMQPTGNPSIKQITFVGSSTLNDGHVASIFVVTADAGGAVHQIPYYFTVNTDGKIDEFH